MSNITRLIKTKYARLMLISSSFVIDESVDCNWHSVLHNFIVMFPKWRPSVSKSFKSKGKTSLNSVADALIISNS